MPRRTVSDPPRGDSLYPTSPTATNDRSTRASSIFPYSTARPPTNYSQQSWVGSSEAPPVPGRSRQPPASPFESALDEEVDETPLYARSDWDQERSPATESSAYSRSSFAGMTTAPPTTALRMNTLGDIQEEDEYDDYSGPARGAAHNGAWAGGELVSSPSGLTSTPSQGVFGDQHMVMSPGAMTATPRGSGFGLGYVDSPGQMTDAGPSGGGRDTARESTLPSVLELEHLTGGTGENPLAEGANHRRPYEQQTPSYTIDPSRYPTSADLGQSPKLMSPGAQQRLGRMSVATARYAAQKQRKTSDALHGDDTTGLELAALPIKGATGIMRFYLTWRIFIVSGLCLTAALLVTISLQNNPGSVSRYVTVPGGVFTKSPNGVNDVGLGVNGWCPIKGTEYEGYQNGDFANADGTYTIPGDAPLSSLGNLLTALCVLGWLLAMYSLVTAFLHFFLFFGLSLPYTHLLDEAVIPAPNGGKGKSQPQIEVDIRFAIAFLFKRSLEDATTSQRISLGIGAYIPLVVFLLTIDPVIVAGRWAFNTVSGAAVFHLRRAHYQGEEWQTLLDPPDPSPAAIMLPPELKPLKHIRNASGDSFFAPRGTVADPGLQTMHGNVAIAPGAELDEETRRWLIAYPADGELVNLIADLRTGGRNDDFLLSEDGLLYLRPEADEPALLVPPRGEIRQELLEDAHHEPDENGNSVHCSVSDMMQSLSDTFWWQGIEEDVEGFIAQCAGCKYDKGGVADVAGLKAGMTPVPFTGVTGWTEKETAGGGGGGVGASAMAAEMAFAMRKAEEQAEKARLG